MELKVIDERVVLGKEFRVYGDIENPLFLARDIAIWIDHNKPNELIANIDDDEKIKIHINPSDSIAKVLQANTNYWFITEEGLYEVLMLSRKPIAKIFKKEVKKILKSIRKHGMYATDELLNNPDLLIKIATKLKEEKEKVLILENKIKEDASKVDFYNTVTQSDTTFDMLVVAKLLNFKKIGRNKLFEILRTKGILNNKNIPYQQYINTGYFNLVENHFIHDGIVDVCIKTVVTQKGVDYLNRLLLDLGHERIEDDI